MVARHADGDACDHRSSIVHLHPLRWPIFSPVITSSTSHFPFTVHEDPWSNMHFGLLLSHVVGVEPWK
ncbi:hypothetical protein ZEAMMB73_Zm00001d008844 [Zea mays]|uniref:Uncharacterized protein n=1 Tax=Zea mays TaxID=4577 RepID=A0A1D6FG99_MAIZE|nr:hypothetical protein ZEAMMB73_Zm00001d008844 [Zea mays]